MKIETRMVDIKTNDGVCDTFVAFPDKPDQHPAVIFYMDGFGLRPYLYKMAEKLAALGFYVLLPNLLYRYKRVPVFDFHFPLKQEDMAQAREVLISVIRGFNAAAAVKDAEFYLSFLSQQKEVRPGKIGITGYCMGGGLAIRTAAQFPESVAAVASFHGGNLATDASDSPHHLLSHLKAEVYIAHADNDQSMPPKQIELLKQALEKSHLKYETDVYSGASHGFTMADLPAYNQAALEKHWIKLSELLKRTLD